MTVLRLVWRNLRFHRRAHAGTLLGAALGSVVLIGALAVGDSVRASLRHLARLRLGKVEWAIDSGERLFRAQLAAELQANLVPAGIAPGFGVTMAPALQLPGVATSPGGERRANRVAVLGVDSRFWQLSEYYRLLEETRRCPICSAPSEKNCAHALESRLWLNPPAGNDATVLSAALAAQLGAKPGDEILLRVQKPSLLSADAPLAPEESSSVALRLRVQAVADDLRGGRFGLRASQLAPLNAFVALGELQRRLGVADRANLLLLSAPVPPPTMALAASVPGALVARSLPGAQAGFPPAFAAFLRQRWQLADAELQCVEYPETGALEVRTRRVFLEPSVAAVIRSNLLRGAVGMPLAPTVAQPPGTFFPPTVPGPQPAGTVFPPGNSPTFPGNFAPQPIPSPSRPPMQVSSVLTYLVNELRVGDRSTPYSMVAAAQPPLLPAGLADDEILINQWLAEDLAARPGDELSLRYSVVGPMRQLEERSARFRVREILPMTHPAMDRTLMPDFPGVTGARSCREWDTGLSIQTDRIRDKDERYWQQYQGTPKALVSLDTGRRLWASRFGELTAVRAYPPGPLPAGTGNRLRPSSWAPGFAREQISRAILNELDPAAFGLGLQPVRDQAQAASSQGQDFGQLFLGFSLFLIAAALLLMAVLFQFGIERRASECGTLLALGFRARQLRLVLLLEGGAVALAGAAVGLWGGAWYARAMLRGLSTVWREAIGGTSVEYSAQPLTLFLGFVGAVGLALATMRLALHRLTRPPIRELLEEGAVGEPHPAAGPAGRSTSAWAAGLAAAGGLGLVAWAMARGEAAPGSFFGAGSLLLVGGWAAVAALLTRLATFAPTRRLTLGNLGLRGATRRRRRSLATVALFACGSFLIAAIGVFKLDAARDASRPSSGTGGFALIGESSQPVLHDLNTRAGLEAYGLDAAALEGVRVVPFRVHEGDDASCLNLNRAQRPRLLGVSPEALDQRRAFTFAQVANGLDPARPWLLLRGRDGDDAVPAIGDQASIQWALGRRVGDTLAYTDERGKTFKVRLVGAVANSILQGNLVIAEDRFLRRFPGTSGYRMFLVDAPSNGVDRVAATLVRGLKDRGLELTPAAGRLAAFNAVQNTYLGTFQVLGGLGLVLGSAGLGAVVLRNVLERRGELALLLAVGWRRQGLRRLVLSEHAALLAAGLLVGVVAALAAVLPLARLPGFQLPYGQLAGTLVLVLVNGLFWAWLATAAALRGSLLDALRNE